jgi:sphingomyelin phosphodiesterase acid-like 3
MEKLYRMLLLLFFCSAIPFAYSANDKAIDYFLALSDIHFDPFISCKTKPCALIQKLREQPTTQWPQILSLYDRQAPQFKKNTNYVLLNSMLKAANQAVESKQAQFVLVLGDFLGHEYYTQYKRFSGDKLKAGYQAFVRKTLVFLTNELKAAFPNISVYMVVGNNDSYQGDYFMIYNGAFFNETASLWSDLIKDPHQRSAMRDQFTQAGYYALDLSKPSHLRLIVLNTNYFSSKAKGPAISDVASKELNWLHAQLQQVKEKNQKALIVMHMPEGFDVYATLHTRLFRLITLWKAPYIKRFQVELETFAPQIAAISPIFGNNPGFKMCAFANGAIQPHDFIDYIYAVHGDNTWKQKYAYSFKQDCSKATCISTLQ